MEDTILKKMQNDLKKSNAIILNNNDNISNIKQKLNSKYTEDISDSEDDLSSYKKRNTPIIQNMKINKNKVKEQPEKKNKSIKNKEVVKEVNNDSSSSSDNKDENNEDTSDDESGEEEVGYEYTEEFKEKVKTYVKNDDKIRDLQTEIKKLNGIKKAAEVDILKHLERLGENNINITGGKLRINQYESKDSLKETIIKEALVEKIKDPTVVETIFTKINEKRVAGSKIQISLKRTFEKGKK
jgi:hypothetical protein